MKRALLLLCLLGTAACHAESWRFAIIGDTPYSEYERRELPKMLAEIADEHPDLIVHVGDFKKSSAPCSDEIYKDRHRLFNASPAPFVYVPGDNEWSDCERLPAGNHDPLERLQKLRQVFFSSPQSLGTKTLPLEKQAGNYPEHLRWRLGPVHFISLNVPGPNNNFGMGTLARREFLARNPSVVEWLKAGFARARSEAAPGVVVVMQGNPGFKHFAAGLPHAGYRELLETLREETLRFSGQVLLIHGDTHWQRIDQPLREARTGKKIANFTRVETFGYPVLGWVRSEERRVG